MKPVRDSIVCVVCNNKVSKRRPDQRTCGGECAKLYASNSSLFQHRQCDPRCAICDENCEQSGVLEGGLCSGCRDQLVLDLEAASLEAARARSRRYQRRRRSTLSDEQRYHEAIKRYEAIQRYYAANPEGLRQKRAAAYRSRKQRDPDYNRRRYAKNPEPWLARSRRLRGAEKLGLSLVEYDLMLLGESMVEEEEPNNDDSG